MTSKISFGVIKPDAIVRDLEREIYMKIEETGFEIYKKKKVEFGEKDVEVIYGHNKEKDFYSNLITYMTMTYCEPFLVISPNGHNAIKELNRIVGPTYSKKSCKGTIRGDMMIKNYFKKLPGTVQNIVHSTLNEKTFLKEVEYFFPEEYGYCKKCMD